MSITVTKEENYSLMKLAQNALEPANTESFKTECVKLIKNNPFLIMNCKELTGINATQKNLLVSIDALAKKAAGSIILTELHDDMIEMMEKAGVNCVPTDDEAVDFMFMEQIESQFMDEDEDDDDDF